MKPKVDDQTPDSSTPEVANEEAKAAKEVKAGEDRTDAPETLNVQAQETDNPEATTATAATAATKENTEEQQGEENEVKETDAATSSTKPLGRTKSAKPRTKSISRRRLSSKSSQESASILEAIARAESLAEEKKPVRV